MGEAWRTGQKGREWTPRAPFDEDEDRLVVLPMVKIQMLGRKEEKEGKKEKQNNRSSWMFGKRGRGAL